MSSRLCRICLEGDGDLIAPCSCRGTGAFVHRTCLDAWRDAERSSAKRDFCTVCRARYLVIRGGAAKLPLWFVAAAKRLGLVIPGAKGLDASLPQGLLAIAVWAIEDIADSGPFKVLLTVALVFLATSAAGMALDLVLLGVDLALFSFLRFVVVSVPEPSDDTVAALLLSHFASSPDIDAASEIWKIVSALPWTFDRISHGMLGLGCLANAHLLLNGLRSLFCLAPDRSPVDQYLDFVVMVSLGAFWTLYAYAATRVRTLLELLPSDLPSPYLLAAAEFHLSFVRWATVSVGVGGVVLPRLWEWAGEKCWEWGGKGGHVADLGGGDDQLEETRKDR